MPDRTVMDIATTLPSECPFSTWAMASLVSAKGNVRSEDRLDRPLFEQRCDGAKLLAVGFDEERLGLDQEAS